MRKNLLYDPYELKHNLSVVGGGGNEINNTPASLVFISLFFPCLLIFTTCFLCSLSSPHPLSADPGVGVRECWLMGKNEKKSQSQRERERAFGSREPVFFPIGYQSGDKASSRMFFGRYSRSASTPYKVDKKKKKTGYKNNLASCCCLCHREQTVSPYQAKQKAK